MKKLSSLLLALVLCLSLAIPAMAADVSRTVREDTLTFQNVRTEKTGLMIDSTIYAAEVIYANEKSTANLPEEFMCARCLAPENMELLDMGYLAFGIYDIESFYGKGATPVSLWRYLSDMTHGLYLLDSNEEDRTCLVLAKEMNASLSGLPALQPSSWAANSVSWAYSYGILPECFQTGFRENTTRAEFCALAAALYDRIGGEEITITASFNDTTDENVLKMASIGVVNGTDTAKGLFSPDAPLTREQAATMLQRLCTYADVYGYKTGEPNFADNDQLHDWGREAVGAMQASGIMNGKDGNKFDPNGAYTREQSVATAVRVVKMRDAQFNN